MDRDFEETSQKADYQEAISKTEDLSGQTVGQPTAQLEFSGTEL